MACGLSAIATSGMAASNSDINQQISKLQAQVTSLQQKVNSTSGTFKAASASGAYVSFDRGLSSVLNSTSKPFGKQKAALDGVHGVVLGGYLRAGAAYERMNPKTGAASDKSNLWLANADLSVAAKVADGLVGFAQVGTDQADAFASTAASGVSLNSAFLAYQLGDGMYVAAGKGDVAFGDMTRVNVYENPVTHGFLLSGNYAMFGMNANGLDATVSLLNGGTSGLAPTPANQINNFAVNVKYALPAAGGVKASVGAGYENASKYSGTVKAKRQASIRNAAYDVNAEVSMDNLNLVGEYIQTADKINNIEANKKASAWNLGASYKLSQLIGNNPATIGVSYGQAKSGYVSDGTLKQLAVSVTQQVAKGVNVGLEYTHINNYSSSTDNDGKDNGLVGVLTTSF